MAMFMRLSLLLLFIAAYLHYSEGRLDISGSQFVCSRRSNPCLNGGRCVSQRNNFARCLCRRGYSGNRCQYRNPVVVRPSRDPCAYYLCYNGGSCVAPADTPRCRCPPGFTGSRCRTQTPLDRCGGCPPDKRCQAIMPMCAPPPGDCLHPQIPRARRSIRCRSYECRPRYVCI